MRTAAWRLPSAAADNGISWELCGRQSRGEVKYVAAQTRQHILIRHAGHVDDDVVQCRDGAS